MINWLNIVTVAGSFGALVGLIDGIYNIVKDNELLLSPIDTILFILFAVIVYALSFMVIIILITLLFSLLKSIFKKKFTFETSMSNLMGMLVFVIYIIFFGFWVNLNLLPELKSSKSIIGNLIIIVIGIVLWILSYRIVNFYKNWIKQPRKFFFRFILALYIVGFVIVLVIVVHSQNISLSQQSPPPDSMNCLLITIDTLRADHLGCYGNDEVNTPNVDKLASEGILFTNAYCNEPLTSPSHATILTSLYPRQHTVVRNGYYLPDEVETIAEILHEKGYNTGAFVGAFPVGSKLNFSQGFHIFNDYFSPLVSISRLTFLKILNHLHIITMKGMVQRKAEDVTSPFISWLIPQNDRPFFAWVHYFDPHTPYTPPDEFIPTHKTIKDENSRQKILYIGEVNYVDKEIGRILEVLEKEMILDDTVIIITADHGESLGEHDYYYDHGHYLYEPSTHIPLIIYSPTLKNFSNYREDQFVSTIDIAPTILDLLDIEPSPWMEGESLLPVIAGREHFPYIYCETYEDNYDLLGVISDNWKLIHNRYENKTELYNLSDDTAELNNLSGYGYWYEKYLYRKLTEWDDLQPKKEEREIEESDKQILKTIGYF